MKIKHLIMVSLLLVILMIGAVSASEDADNLTVDNNGEEDVIASSIEDIGGENEITSPVEDDGGDEEITSSANEDIVAGDTDPYYAIYVPNKVAVDNNTARMFVHFFNQNATGNITVKLIDGDNETTIYDEAVVPYDSVNYTGGNNIYVKDLNLNIGKNVLEFCYTGDDTYKSFTKNYTINIYFIDVKVYDEITKDQFYIYLANSTTGKVEVLIDDKSFANLTAEDLAESKYYLNLTELSYGNHTYSIYYDGDDYELDEPFEGEFNLTYRFDVDIDDYDVDLGTSVIFTIYYPSDADGQLTVTYNNITLIRDIIADYDDEMEMSLVVGFVLGENNITFTYNDTKYPVKSVVKTVNVEMGEFDEDDFDYGTYVATSKYSPVLYFSSPIYGNLEVYVNGTKRYSEFIYDSDSTFIYLNELNITENGTYAILFNFTNDDYGEFEFEAENITVAVEDWDELQDEYILVRSEVDLLSIVDNFVIVSDNDGVVGAVAIYVDNISYYIDSFTNESQIGLVIRPPDLNNAYKIGVGSHRVKVIYYKNYTEEHVAERNVVFSAVPKYDRSFYLSVGENRSVDITFLKGTTGIVSAYFINYTDSSEVLGDLFKTVDIIDGVASIPLNSLSEGDYRFTLNITSNTYNRTYNPYTTDFYVYTTENTPGYNATVTPVNITEGDYVVVTFNGNISEEKVYIYLDDTYLKSIPLTNGSICENVSISSYGQHTIRVYFEDGDDFYSNTFFITAKPNQSSFKYEIYGTGGSYITSKSGFVISFWRNPVNGTLTVYVNGTERYSQFIDEYSGVYPTPNDLNITENGTYAISFTFTNDIYGEYVWDGDNVTVIFDIVDDYAYLYSTIDILEHKYIIARISDSEGVIGNVTIFIDGKQYYYNFLNETNTTKAYLYVDDLNIYDNLTIGTHRVKIIYNRNNTDEHVAEKFVNFKYSPKYDYVYEMSVGEKRSIDITFITGTTGTIIAYFVNETEDDYILGDIFQIVNITDGLASIPLDSLPEGDYMLALNFTSNTYNKTYSLYDIDVYVEENAPGYNATVTPATITVGENITVTFSGNKSDKKVTIELDGNTFKYVSLENGTVSETISGLAVGQHRIHIKFEDEDVFYSNTFFVTVNNLVDPKITAFNLKVIYTAGKYYTVTVYGTNGKVAANTKVTFLINGKTFKIVTTNANGVASVKITQKPGTYKITTKALGKSVVKTLTVKHVLKLKKVKVKRSAKKLVIKATLSKVNGKYLKGKKITLKFKGKKYTKKTNKKGVAKFTIKKKVLKKLKKGKKITYKATYLKDTVKKTVKVKK